MTLGLIVGCSRFSLGIYLWLSGWVVCGKIEGFSRTIIISKSSDVELSPHHLAEPTSDKMGGSASKDLAGSLDEDRRFTSNALSRVLFDDAALFKLASELKAPEANPKDSGGELHHFCQLVRCSLAPCRTWHRTAFDARSAYLLLVN